MSNHVYTVKPTGAAGTEVYKSAGTAVDSEKQAKVVVRVVPSEFVDKIRKVEKTVAERGFLQVIADTQ